ncbi:hypothetical protein AA637_03390 [Cyanobacterium sp. HL-69]|nr:hypothetical protein AA637_03390 [Cyanobacterium sp. HL-69]
MFLYLNYLNLLLFLIIIAPTIKINYEEKKKLREHHQNVTNNYKYITRKLNLNIIVKD